jgi:hypothetical protein
MKKKTVENDSIIEERNEMNLMEFNNGITKENYTYITFS